MTPIKVVVGAPKLSNSIQDISSPDSGATSGFKAFLAICGDVQFTADLYYFVDGDSPDGPHALSDQAQSLFYFGADGTFEPFEDD